MQLPDVPKNVIHASALIALPAPAWVPTVADVSSYGAATSSVLGALWLGYQLCRAIIKDYRAAKAAK